MAGRVELGANLAVMGSAVLMRSENKSDDPSVSGKDAKGTPSFSTSLQMEYKVLGIQGLTLTGGGRYVGETALNDDNSHMIDSYTLFDLGLRYQTQMGKQGLTLRANLDNLSNEKYWMGSWGYSLTQGAPRTVRVSAEMSF
jgi:iron complex outermembrane receptor protein